MTSNLIMLIEDNPDDEALTKRAIVDNKFDVEVVVAHDGEQAIEMLLTEDTQKRVNPFVILLDLKLPKISGIEVLKKLRSNPLTKHKPIIILTTSVEDSDIASSYDNGANSYLRKQTSYKDFVSQIGYMVNYWLLCNKQIN